MLNPVDVFNAFNAHRGDAIVSASGTAGRHWTDISDNPAHDISLGGAMGHTTSAAFGLALGLPDEKVALFDAEGSLLMNLGVIASIAGMKPANFYHFVLDNECYATTGGQPVPNAAEIDYAAMAKGAGYAAAYNFDDLEEFAGSIESIMNEPGPVLIAVKIQPEVQNLPIGLRERRPSRSRAQTIEELRAELGISAD